MLLYPGTAYALNVCGIYCNNPLAGLLFCQLTSHTARDWMIFSFPPDSRLICARIPLTSAAVTFSPIIAAALKITGLHLSTPEPPGEPTSDLRNPSNLPLRKLNALSLMYLTDPRATSPTNPVKFLNFGVNLSHTLEISFFGPSNSILKKSP